VRQHIAFYGEPGAGKSTCARLLIEFVGTELGPYKRAAFADALRLELADILAAKLGGTPLYWFGRMTDPQTKEEYRPLMQAYGALRRHLDPDHWVTQLLETLASSLGVWTVDDVRYDNEFAALKRKGFRFVLVERPGHTNARANMSHESEQDWRRWWPDAVLVNDGTTVDLIGKLRRLRRADEAA
jgi:hypothetical protein